MKLSYDEGKTWPVSRVLEPGFSGYSDLAVGWCWRQRKDGFTAAADVAADKLADKQIDQ